mmetsp:Transcript_22811/g.28128  ORF Transcript_22811/g.28128 Transcript_22811/m.28128 type:complete len:92 (+) Transcript_22811:196-471(+)
MALVPSSSSRHPVMVPQLTRPSQYYNYVNRPQSIKKRKAARIAVDRVVGLGESVELEDLKTLRLLALGDSTRISLFGCPALLTSSSPVYRG